MPPLIVPESFAFVLAACAPCFTAPTYRVFCHLVAGWLHCPGRHTVTGVAVAAGAEVVGWRHVSAFHRFFGRARWEPDALGRVVFALALRALPVDAPVILLVDDSLARKEGKALPPLPGPGELMERGMIEQGKAYRQAVEETLLTDMARTVKRELASRKDRSA